MGGHEPTDPPAGPSGDDADAPDGEPRSTSRTERAAAKVGATAVRRHIFLCADTGEAKCASRRAMKDAVAFLKARLKALGLARQGGVLVTKTACLDVCRGGPIAVVYPEGTWYGGCDEAGLERIVTEHVLGGRVVADLAIARPPLLAPGEPLSPPRR